MTSPKGGGGAPYIDRVTGPPGPTGEGFESVREREGTGRPPPAFPRRGRSMGSVAASTRYRDHREGPRDAREGRDGEHEQFARVPVRGSP